MLTRLRDLCDAHFRLRLEKLGLKQGTTLEVQKADNVELTMDNSISFEVLPGLGLQLLPVGRVRA